MSNSLLLVEDNEDILKNLYEFLEPLGYELDCARNGATGLKMALSGNFDCIILDILLPGMDGITFCRKFRDEFKCVTPVIMLTALGDEEERIVGLDAGADDYLAKPFSMRELEARIRAILRRGYTGLNQAGNSLSFGEVNLNPMQHRAYRQGKPLCLGPSSFRILHELLRAAPGIVRKEYLENLLWSDEAHSESALRNHILELRRELDKPFDGKVLQTVPHIGYRLLQEPEI